MKIFKYGASVLFLAMAVSYLFQILVPSGFISFLMALALAIVFFKAEIEVEPRIKKFFKK